MKTRYKKTMTGGEAVVESMKIEGVEQVFNVPGESFLAVLDALEGQDDIRLLSTRHEGGAGFMAEGYAKVSGKVGVAMATRGVGASNASIAIHTAYQDSTPMVVFFGQVHRDFRGREGFQEVDFGKNFTEFAKWTVEIDNTKRVPELVQKAFRVAQTGRPGPVIVSLPEDMLMEEAEMVFGPPAKKSRPAPSTDEVASFGEMLAEAKKPLIIAGGGVRLSKAEEALLSFLEKYDLPIMSGFRRQDFMDNRHPAFVGHLGLNAAKPLVNRVKESDLIIALGTRLSEATSQDYTVFSWDQKLVHIDIDAGTIGKVYVPELGIVSDIKSAVEAFEGLKLDKKWTSWQRECKESFNQVLENAGDETIYSQVIEAMTEMLPENRMLTTDAGNFAVWLNAKYRVTRSNSLIGPTNGAMGYGLPAAIGAKHADPSRTVVALCGDGGLMMTVQEVESSVRANMPVICLVFNNRMYGTIRMHQEMHYPEKVIGTDLGEIDFVKMAEGMGAQGFHAETREEFQAAFEAALKADRTTVIDIKCDKENIVPGKTIETFRERTVQN